MLVIWNERPMPMCARRCTDILVMSCTLKNGFAACGLIFAGQQVEKGRFARTVRSDDRVGATALDLHRDVVDRHQPTEFFTQVVRFQKRQFLRPSIINGHYFV